MNKLQELNDWFHEAIKDIEYNHEPKQKQVGSLKFSVVGDEVENYLVISLISEKSIYDLYTYEINPKNTDIKGHLAKALKQAMLNININSRFGAELEIIGELFITYH